MKHFLLTTAFVIFGVLTTYSQCTAGFTYVQNGLTFDFTNTSTTDSSTADTWQWSFGDGNLSGNNDPQHVYTSPGTYQVCLFIVDFTNCMPNPTMQYCDSVTITGGTPCQASFTYTQNGTTFDFTNTSSSDSATASQWQWSFGDGNFSNNNDPQHIYAGPGTYQVCLFWVDFVNCPTTPTMQFCDSVTITGPPPCQASFTYTQNGTTFDFTNTSSSDSATASQWQWSFGDGNFSNNNDPQHIYAGPGTYQVCLFWVDFVNCPTTPTMQYCDSVTIIPVGISDLNKIGFDVKLYPNPANDWINLRFESQISQELIINIYDVIGQLKKHTVYSTKASNNEIKFKISEWSKGTYFISIQDKTGKFQERKKFIK